MLFYITIVFVVGKAAAQNSCPEAKGLDNFDFKTYAKDRWFEVGRYDCILEKGADCVVFTYTSEGDDTFCTLSEVIDKNIKTYKMRTVIAPDAGNTGKLFYSSYKNVGVNVTIYVLDTDYENYAIFYNCKYDDVKKVPLELAWVKSRTPAMKPEIRAKVEMYLRAHPLIDETRMVWDHFTHEDCLIDV